MLHYTIRLLLSYIIARWTVKYCHVVLLLIVVRYEAASRRLSDNSPAGKCGTIIDRSSYSSTGDSPNSSSVPAFAAVARS